MRRKKKTESRIESYGKSEILDELAKSSTPERDVWAGVILQAIVNVRFKVNGWVEDVYFLSGGRNFAWICEQLGYDTEKTSKACLITAFDKDKAIIHKH